MERTALWSDNIGNWKVHVQNVQVRRVGGRGVEVLLLLFLFILFIFYEGRKFRWENVDEKRVKWRRHARIIIIIYSIYSIYFIYFILL